MVSTARSQPQSRAPVALAPVERRGVLIAMIGLLLGLLLGGLDQTIVAIALPTIVGELGGLKDLSWIVTAYILASTVSLPLWGKAGDVYGRKRLFEVAVVIFVGGSVLCALAEGMTSLIAFRALQGVGTGGIFVLAMAIVGDLVSPRERGKYQGYIQGTFAFASVAGPLVGGFLLDHVGWRSVFYLNLPLGIVALAAIRWRLRIAHTSRPHAIDYLGAGLLAGALSLLLLVLVWGGTTYAWDSSQVIALAAAALVFGGLFIVRERLTDEPVLPLTMLTNRTVAVSSATLFLSTFAVFGAVVFLQQYLQIVRGYSATNAGLLLLPMMLMMALSATVVGRVITATGTYKVFPILGSAIAAASLAGFALMNGQTPALVVAALTSLFGLGFGMIGEVLILAVQNEVSGRDLGTAMGAANLFRALGGAVGAAALGSVFVAQAQAHLPQPPMVLASIGGLLHASPSVVRELPPAVARAVIEAINSGLSVVFIVGAGAAAAGFLISLVLPEPPLRRDAPAA